MPLAGLADAGGSRAERGAGWSFVAPTTRDLLAAGAAADARRALLARLRERRGRRAGRRRRSSTPSASARSTTPRRSWPAPQGRWCAATVPTCGGVATAPLDVGALLWERVARVGAGAARRGRRAGRGVRLVGAGRPRADAAAPPRSISTRPGGGVTGFFDADGGAGQRAVRRAAAAPAQPLRGGVARSTSRPTPGLRDRRRRRPCRTAAANRGGECRAMLRAPSPDERPPAGRRGAARRAAAPEPARRGRPTDPPETPPGRPRQADARRGARSASDVAT